MRNVARLVLVGAGLIACGSMALPAAARFSTTSAPKISFRIFNPV